MFKKALISTVAGLAMLGASASMNAASADSNPLGLLLGAAAGGYVGSNIGSGNGRLVATAVGTLLGAAIGSNVTGSSHTSYATTTHRTVYNPAPYPYGPGYGYGYAYAPAPRHRANVYVDNRTYIDNRTYVSQTSTTVNHTDVTTPVRYAPYPNPWGYHR